MSGRLSSSYKSQISADFSARSKRFDDGNIGNSATFAHRLQPESSAPRVQGMDESRHQFGPAGAQRMAERNGAAVDVQPLRIGADFQEPGERDGGERLIDFIEV